MRLRSNIAKEAGLTYDELGDIPFPPICCFDGINFKEKQEIEKQYSNVIGQYESGLTKISRTSKNINRNERRLKILTKFYSHKNRLTKQGKDILRSVLAPKRSQQI